MVSRHIKHRGLVLLGGKINANFSFYFSLNCQFSLSTFLLAVNLEHAIFVQSRGSYSQQNFNSELLQKRKWPNQDTWSRNNSSGATNRPIGWMRVGHLLFEFVFTLIEPNLILIMWPTNGIFVFMLCAVEIAGPFIQVNLTKALQKLKYCIFLCNIFSSVHFNLFSTSPLWIEWTTSQLLIHNAMTTGQSLNFFLAPLNKLAQRSCQTDMVEDTVLVTTEAWGSMRPYWLF